MIPLWDDIQIPPDHTLRDINGLDQPLRDEMQARALELFVDEENGGDWTAAVARDWSDDEGIFVVLDPAGDIVGIQIMLEVE